MNARRRGPLAATLVGAALWTASPAFATDPPLVEVAAAAGLDFRHWNGRTGRLYDAEVLAPGLALFDYDGDHDLDLLVLQGNRLDLQGKPVDPPPSLAEASSLGAVLYANRGTEHGLPRFVDVTARSGLTEHGYGMGVATGDIDNDGHVDLLVTRLDGATLWRNRGDGTFADESAARGLAVTGWATSATFFDADRDGWLDLYVARYVDWSPALDRACFDSSSRPDYCGPLSYRPLPDLYFHNRGDGTFEEASVASGIGGKAAAGLGVAAADLDRDGWQDLYVANDATANFFWRNRGDGTFEEVAAERGCAYDLSGVAEAGMGLAIADLDGDRDEDLLVTNLAGESITLYTNSSDGWFEDRTLRAGLGASSLPFTSFGTAVFDLGNDGLPDIVVANGAIRLLPARLAAGDPFPLGQRNLLYRGLGGGRFRAAPPEAVPGLAAVEVSRGVALGDLDGDGAQDVVIANNNGPLRALLDRSPDRGHWLGLRLRTNRRDALGARVFVHTGDGKGLLGRVHSDGSYLSAGDPRVWFGLGATAILGELWVRWPSGEAERFPPPLVDRVVVLERGRGRALAVAEFEATLSAQPAAAGGAPSPGPAATPAASATPAAPGATPGDALEGVELPDLGDLEPVVRQTLEAALAAARSSPPAETAAAAWGELGRDLHGHGFLPQAVTAYRNAERLDPRSARWPYLRGLAAATAGDLAAARPAFARARELAPAAPWPRLRLASLQRQEGEFTGLDDLLLPVVDDLTLPRGLRALAAAMRAEAARLEERLPAAIANYRQALDLEPAASALRAPLAQLLRQTGDVEAAARERALAGNRRPQAVDPEAEALESLDRSGAGFARRGQEALRRGDDPAALTALREAHRMLPADAGVAVNLAVALQHLDQPDAARAVLTEALAADPQQPMANFNLGVLEAAAGRDRTAIAAYEAALRSDPRLLDARFNLANAHWRLGEDAAAIAAWRAVLAGDPLRSDARSALVRVLAAAQDRAGALALADEGLHLAPSDPDRMEEVARLLATATADAGGDSARALKLAEACLAASRTLDHVETAAMVYAAAGRFLDAARWQQAAVRVAEEAGATDRRDQLAGVLARYLAGQTAAAPWPGRPEIRIVGRLPGALHAPSDR